MVEGRKNMDKKTVLVVEDKANWLEMLTRKLKDEFDVTGVSSYDEAIDAIHSQSPPYHVAIIDIELNGDESEKNGLDLIEKITHMDLPIYSIVLTGHPSTPYIRRIISDLSIFDYFYKAEMELDILHQAVREAAEEAQSIRNPYAFVAMPFAEDFRDIYDDSTAKTLKS
jgi:DNA-binding NarL/FixJ family response regulator